MPAKTLKQEVVEMIQSLPDETTLEDIQYALYVRQKVEEGLRDIAEGRTVPHDEVVRQVRDLLARHSS